MALSWYACDAVSLYHQCVRAVRPWSAFPCCCPTACCSCVPCVLAESGVGILSHACGDAPVRLFAILVAPSSLAYS
jgi:hypothetical protein